MVSEGNADPANSGFGGPELLALVVVSVRGTDKSFCLLKSVPNKLGLRITQASVEKGALWKRS